MVSFVIVVIMVDRRISFGLAMFAGAFIILLTSGLGFFGLELVVKEILAPSVLYLALVILLISILGYCYKATGQIERLVKHLRLFVPDHRVNCAAVPAIFGLLPMPGGALLSAPMVKKEADALSLNPEEGAFHNIWFRHSIYYIFPLFPGIILAAELSGVDVYAVAAYQAPVFIAGFAIPYFMYLRKFGRVENGKKGSIWPLMNDLLPIIAAIVFTIILGVPLALALGLGILIILIQNEMTVWKGLKTLYKGISPNLLLAVFGIMVFKRMVEASGVMVDVAQGLTDIGVPLMVLVITIPFLVGLITGSELGCIGVTFPIFIPLLPEVTVPMVSLLYVGAFLGYVISPLHLCVVLTAEYFHARLGPIIKMYVVPGLLTFLVSLLSFFLFG